jgi:hypothetical protein
MGLYEARECGDPVRADGVLSALRRKSEDDAVVAVRGRMTDPVVIPGAEDDRALWIGDGDVATPMDLETATEGEDHTCVVSVCSSSAGADSLARQVTS